MRNAANSAAAKTRTTPCPFRYETRAKIGRRECCRGETPYRWRRSHPNPHPPLAPRFRHRRMGRNVKEGSIYVGVDKRRAEAPPHVTVTAHLRCRYQLESSSSGANVRHDFSRRTPAVVGALVQRTSGQRAYEERRAAFALGLPKATGRRLHPTKDVSAFGRESTHSRTHAARWHADTSVPSSRCGARVTEHPPSIGCLVSAASTGHVRPRRND